ncbi:MAG: hypothetical protein GF330_06070, partial [Candidatus Eisenbacteria bacterium]|nr:hypothetical protein [Candidatus Eisenbacteria bacterium]
LQVNHIIVCGHTDCGGIRALATGIDAGREPHIAEWLAQVRPIWEATGTEELTPDARHLEVVRRSALQQRENLHSYPVVAAALEAGVLELHAWLLDLQNGELQAYDDGSQGWTALQ